LNQSKNTPKKEIEKIEISGSELKENKRGRVNNRVNRRNFRKLLKKISKVVVTYPDRLTKSEFKIFKNYVTEIVVINHKGPTEGDSR